MTSLNDFVRDPNRQDPYFEINVDVRPYEDGLVYILRAYSAYLNSYRGKLRLYCREQYFDDVRAQLLQLFHLAEIGSERNG